jgi:pimeloyl-ACP methyl ester carboxylesterase
VSPVAQLVDENDERIRIQGQSNDYFLFVHGWRMQEYERVAYAENSYKRMYWAGYKGQFGMFDWPTQYTDDPVNDPGNFDRSEYVAWSSSDGLANAVSQIRDKMSSDGKLTMLAHSMGAIVASEALTKLSPGMVNNTILSQGAVSDHYFDASYPETIYNDAYGATAVSRRTNAQTPVYYWGFHVPGIGAATFPRFSYIGEKTRLVNFFNPDDYALMAWRIDQGMKPSQDANATVDYFAMWQTPPSGIDLSLLVDALSASAERYFAGASYHLTPDTHEFSRFTDAKGTTVLDDTALGADLYEMFAFCASSITLPVGQLNLQGGAFDHSVDLRPLSNKFDQYPQGHSTEFNHAYINISQYWQTVITESTQ